MDITQLIAIDTHTHLEVSCRNPFDSYGEEYDRAADKYFQYANTLLEDRILFGSDFPLITPERWLKDFEEAGFKDEVKPLILKANAVRLLNLGASRPV